MAAPGKQSRWGSFLSQAVAGVESRLDNMLAEPEDARPQDSSATASPAGPASPAPMTTKQQPASQQLAVPAKPSPGKLSYRRAVKSIASCQLAGLANLLARKLAILVNQPHQ